MFNATVILVTHVLRSYGGAMIGRKSEALWVWPMRDTNDEHRTAQRERNGKHRATEMGELFCKLPRSVSTARPLKKHAFAALRRKAR